MQLKQHVGPNVTGRLEERGPIFRGSSTPVFVGGVGGTLCGVYSAQVRASAHGRAPRSVFVRGARGVSTKNLRERDSERGSNQLSVRGGHAGHVNLAWFVVCPPISVFVL
jgi:hypothetical protein